MFSIRLKIWKYCIYICVSFSTNKETKVTIIPQCVDLDKSFSIHGVVISLDIHTVTIQFLTCIKLRHISIKVNKQIVFVHL